MKNRMRTVLLIFAVVIICIIAKLGYEQLFHASQLENGALNARLREVDIKPNRGAIYDRKGNQLAISIATESDRKSTRQNSSHNTTSRMPSSA